MTQSNAGPSDGQAVGQSGIHLSPEEPDSLTARQPDGLNE
jgi:hypothetical protein